jgi:hypothetical protein
VCVAHDVAGQALDRFVVYHSGPDQDRIAFGSQIR